MLLAELFLQVQVGGCSIKILGQALLDLLEITLSCEIDSRIKHVCQIFKVSSKKLMDVLGLRVLLNILTLFIVGWHVIGGPR